MRKLEGPTSTCVPFFSTWTLATAFSPGAPEVASLTPRTHSASIYFTPALPERASLTIADRRWNELVAMRPAKPPLKSVTDVTTSERPMPTRSGKTFLAHPN